MLKRVRAIVKEMTRKAPMGVATLLVCMMLASCGGTPSTLSPAPPEPLAQSAVAPTEGAEAEASETKTSETEAPQTKVLDAEVKTSEEATLPAEGLATATFAGGCFWCMEGPFDQLEGVVSTTSGYAGGFSENPTYGQVSAGITGHTESVQVVYDPEKIDYATLLETYWVNVDPLDSKGQFCDKGSQYRSAIFYSSEEEQQLAEASKAEVAEKFEQPIATEVIASGPFYPAEDYHQDFYTKNPVRYKIYRTGCGRDRRLAQLWGEDAAH